MKRKVIGGIIAGILIFFVGGCCFSDTDKVNRLTQEELEARTIELSNGNYVAGTDFEAGTYTITAINGNGNVYSSNMFSGGLNAIMGTNNDGFYELEYKNIKLPVGTTLTIDGVTVRLTPSK